MIRTRIAGTGSAVPDRVVTNAELLKNVWHGASVTKDSIPRAAMVARSTLGDDERRPRFIGTVRGRGYRFVAEVSISSEGAVRLGLRKELEQIDDEDERERRVQALTKLAYENADVLNAAQLFELDDVIDPADTRAIVARTLAAAGTLQPSGRPVDSW